ncbi:MAG: FtsX-like permease family protein [Bacteroidota bacterium]
MKLTFFIARRIIFNTQPSFSRFIIRLAVTATALSVAAMIITLSMVNGFQEAVSRKVFSFWGHVRIQALSPIRSMVSEEGSFKRTDTIEAAIRKVKGITHYQSFAVKSVVLKTRENFEGVLLKGIDRKFEKQPFDFIKSGKTISFTDSGYSRDILLSEHTAKQLDVIPGDTLQCIFIRGSDDIRTRPLIVSGLYKTGIEEYDNSFALADLNFLRRLNLWDSTEVGGYEAWIDPEKSTDSVIARQVRANLPQGLSSYTIKQLYPNIFDWLAIQDQTKMIVVGVMILVAVINLITCLLILVMERTRMVGVLKAIGLSEAGISRIFWYYAGYISLTGIGLGLIIGLGLCWLQQYTGFIKMDEATYYVAFMPVHIIWWQVAAVAIGSFIICFLALRLPLLFVKTISPVKAIRFD